MTTTTRREAPHHNNLTCYTDYQCRLPDCVERYNARNRERIRARKAGTYNAFTNAEPVRRHLIRLQQAGMGADSIATAAGVHKQSILEFLRPTPTQGRGRRQRTTPATAAKILAVTPDNRTNGRINATGTIRRIQALVALGWPVTHIARHAGLANANATEIMQRQYVYVATAKTIAATYNQLRTKRPEKNGVTKPHVAVAKNRAARQRWAPPKYWDQHPDAIDDPGFEPMHGILRAEIIAQDARWLIATGGLDRGQAAERLGVSRSYIDRALKPQGPSDQELAA